MISNDNNRKYAIFGGTFDPIHKAHVYLADYAVKEFDLYKLYFMPAASNPFKKGKKHASDEHRLNMIKGIIDYNDKFDVSDYEINKGGLSYCIETLNEWNNKNLGELYFILGFDSLMSLDTWHQGEEILRNYPIITGKRPGIENTSAFEKISQLEKDYSANISILDMPEFNISSSLIKENIKNNKSISELVFKSTEEYIFEHNLYR